VLYLLIVVVGLRFVFMPAAGSGGIMFCGRMSGSLYIVHPPVCFFGCPSVLCDVISF